MYNLTRCVTYKESKIILNASSLNVRLFTQSLIRKHCQLNLPKVIKKWNELGDSFATFVQNQWTFGQMLRTSSLNTAITFGLNIGDGFFEFFGNSHDINLMVYLVFAKL